MSSVHEGCLQGKSVRDREGSKHSTAATLERVYSEAAVLPQDFEDTVHARQLKALCRSEKSGAKDESSRSGTLTFNGTHAHLNAARPREKVEWGPALREFENFVGSRFTPACNTSTDLRILRLLPAVYYLYQRIIKTRGPRHAQHRALHVVSPTVVVTVVVVVHPCRDGTSWQLIVVNVIATCTRSGLRFAITLC